MERLRDRRDYDTASIIQLFLQSSLAVDVVPHEEGLVAQLCSETIDVFQNIIAQLHTSIGAEAEERSEEHDDREVRISLKRSCNRLMLWSDGYGIGAGKFDETFAKSQKLRRATLKILISVSETLFTRLPSHMPVVPANVSKPHDEDVQKLKILIEAAQIDIDDNESSSDGSSEYDSDSLTEIAEDLRVDTMCLMDLDTLLRNPILDLEREKSVLAIGKENWTPHDAYSERIGARFPKANESLVSRLGKAAYQRYLRCQAERDKQESGIGEEAPENLLLAHSDASSSKFRDSALGSSVPSSASNAETVMSYYHGDGSQSIGIPSLPQEGKAGNPFSCIACGNIIIIRSNSAWKRHLYNDLLPWQCLDLDCSFTGVFTNRKDWTLHMSHDHGLGPDWKATKCPLCLDEIGPGKTQITRHLGGHLEEISLGALPSEQPDAESDNDSDQDSSDAEPNLNDEDDVTEPKRVQELTGSDDEHDSGSASPSQRVPVINEATDYLDKIREVYVSQGRPECYNRFLDIMKDFKSQTLDTLGVMTRVRDLFLENDHQVDLLRGFMPFLPQGYSFDENLDIVTPVYTQTQTSASHESAPVSGQDYYRAD